jgi:DNA polymerase-3 subunit epsilon
MSQVDWAGEGFEGTKLSYLASQCGFFFDGHRAENDCLAGLEILARPLPSGRTAPGPPAGDRPAAELAHLGRTLAL